jgi:hypothetical protein
MKAKESWLLGSCPQKETAQPEAKLWWAVVRQAAWDLRYANRSRALDALEFLRDSGAYLISWLFSVPVEQTIEEVGSLVLSRNRFHQQPLRPGDGAHGTVGSRMRS